MPDFIADLPIADRLREIRSAEGRTPLDPVRCEGIHDYDWSKHPAICRRCGHSILSGEAKPDG